MDALINFTAYWHRDEDNKLRRGILLQGSQKCTTSYDIYIPNNLHDCPHVVILSTNPHNHPPSLPIKTPPQIVDCFESLLSCLEWKLADATPRRLALDSGFIYGLRHALAWPHHERDPSPHDLHPSLGNLDHLRRLINVSRLSKFPHGTGFYGILYHLRFSSCYSPPLLQVQKTLSASMNGFCQITATCAVWSSITFPAIMSFGLLSA